MAGPVTSAIPQSGYAPNMDSYGYPQWEATVVRNLITNLNSGNPAKNGQPGSWNSAEYGDWSLMQWKANNGTLGIAESSALVDFVRSGGLDQDSMALGWGARPAASGDDYTRTAAQSAQDLAWAGYDLNVRQQDFAESKYALDSALKNAQLQFAASNSGGGGTRASSGGGGGGGGSSSSGGISDAQMANIALEQARMKLEEELARGRLAMDQAQLAATIAYQNAQLAQNASQFGETMAYNKQRDEQNNQLTLMDLQNKRASEVAALSANPADWVQRDYFTRGRGSPQGQRTDAFTGEQVQPGQLTTLPELMTEQVGMVPAQPTGPGLTEAGQGVGADANPAAANPLFNMPVEGFARGSFDQIPSSNGLVTAKQALVGEKRTGRTPGPNAEMLINPTGAPFAIVSNDQLPDFKREGDGWVPGYNHGTLPDNWIPGFAGSSYDSSGNITASGQAEVDAYYAQQAKEAEQRAAYAESIPTMAEYRSGIGQLPTAYNPYENEADPNALVTNRNSPYYGMTNAEAAKYQTWANTSPLGGDQGGAQGGSLTGAQLSQGVTQSVNPRGAGYKPNAADVTPPAGTVGRDIHVTSVAADGGTTSSTTSDTGVPVSPADTAKALAYPPGKTVDTKDAYKKVVGFGAVTTADGGGKLQLMEGDYLGPPDAQGNTTYYRWDPTLSKYRVLPYTPTMINNEQEFRLLPPEIQQAILTGKSSGYMVNTSGAGYTANWMTNMQAGMNNTGGTNPPMSADEFRSLPPEQQKALLSGQQPGAAAIGGFYSKPTSGQFDNQNSGLNAGATSGMYQLGQLPAGRPFDYADYLSVDEYDSLMNPPGTPTPLQIPDVMTGMPWGGMDFFPDATWQYLKPKRGIMSDWVDTSTGIMGRPLETYDTPGQGRVMRSYAGPDSRKRYAVGPDGTIYVSEMSGAAWNKATIDQLPEGLVDARPEGWEPLNPELPNVPPDPMQLPALQAEYQNWVAAQEPQIGGGIPAPTPDFLTWYNTIKNPQAPAAPGTPAPAQPPPAIPGAQPAPAQPAAGEPTPAAPGTPDISSMPLSELLAFLQGPSGMSVLNYSPDVIQNAPSLQFINGTIGAEQWQYVSSQPTTIPALGVTLPPPSSLNYGNLQMLQTQDPSSFAAMASLWKAGNRDLQSEMQIARERAPLGSSFKTSLIKTY